VIEPIERAKQISEYLVSYTKDTFSSKEKEFLKSDKFIDALNGAIQHFRKMDLRTKQVVTHLKIRAD